MAKTISQRISLEGSEDIAKKLEQLGRAGAEAFKTIQDAAKKPIADPAQVERTRQAIDQLVQAGTKLGQQFQALSGSAQQFGTAGAQSAQQVTTALDKTGKAAEQVGAGFQQSAVKFGAVAGAVAGVFQAATSKLIGVVGQLRAAFAPGALLKGVVETGKELSDQADKLKLTVPEWLKLSKAIAEAGVSEEDFIKATSKLAKTIADAKGGFIEIMPGTLVSTSRGAVAVMTDLAKSISILGNSAQAASLGTKHFGENWKEIIKALIGGKAAADAADDVFDKLAKVDRALSPDQAEKAAQLAKGWDVLAKAIRAAKDQIGTVFLDSALTRAEWLIKLIDGSRELFKTWAALAEAKKAAFLEGLGESPSEILFKTLVAVSTQLAGIWRDVLVPAGNALMNIFKQISGQFEGVSKSQVAAFFITATAAAIGLAVALKAIQFVLAPLALLFTGFGPVLIAAGVAAFLFWDKIKEGATAAAALIPNSLHTIAVAFQNLFAGNFSLFWEQFSRGATTAFQTIMITLRQTEGVFGDFARALSGEQIQTPWVQTLVDGLKAIARDGPAAILLVIQALGALGQAATGVANAINKIFGTQLTGTDIAVIAIVAQLTGGLQALAAAATIVGGILTALVATITLVGVAFGATAAAFVGGAVLIGAALVGIVVFWDQIVAGATNAFNAVVNFSNALDAAVFEAFKNAGVAAMDAINGAINAVVGTISSLIGAIGDAINALLRLLGLSSEVGNPGPGRGATGSFAGGGRVGGRGTGTSDSNLAWVSRGEHIMPARAVRQPGVLAFLEALRRSGGNLSRVLDGMGRFATGGLALPSFAAGGLAGMSNVTIQFPGLPAIGGLRAPGDVVEELRKAAVVAQVRSGGRKPSRYS